MPRRGLWLKWRLNKIMDQKFLRMITERRFGHVLGSVSRNEAVLLNMTEITCNLNINLSSEASIFRKDAVYTKSKIGSFGPINLQAKITVVDHKKRGIQKV